MSISADPLRPSRYSTLNSAGPGQCSSMPPSGLSGIAAHAASASWRDHTPRSAASQTASPLEAGDRGDPGFPSSPAFHHALQRLEGVEPVDVQPGETDRQRFLELHPLLVLEPGAAPRHRQRGAGHQRRAEAGGALAHPAAVAPVPGEVLVVEDRDAAAAGRHDAADLLHEIAPRVELLLLLVPGVVPVLADQQHAVDRQGVPSQRQGAGNAVVDRDPVLGGDAPADVGVGNWSMYIEATSTRGGTRPASVGKPSRYLPTRTSAWEPRKYWVMIAAMRLRGDKGRAGTSGDRGQGRQQRLDVADRVGEAVPAAAGVSLERGDVVGVETAVEAVSFQLEAAP